MSGEIQLREVADRDLPSFFQPQLDPEANQMAALTAKDPADRAAFDGHWAHIRADDGITIRTVLVGMAVAGYVLVHSWFGAPEIIYWLGREFWGRGVATRALVLFLAEVVARSLFGRVVHDDIASRRVLEKCGFAVCASDRGYASATLVPSQCCALMWFVTGALRGRRRLLARSHSAR